MPDGGELRIETSDVDPTLAVQMTGRADDVRYVGLAISDSGPTGAFPAETGDVANRTGLGLALVYSTVQMAGGRIRLESLPGHGSTVRILLPIATGAGPYRGEVEDVGGGVGSGPVPARASGALGAAEAGDAPGGLVTGGDVPLAVGSALIAVVEDEPGVRSLVERLLIRGGHRVLAFPDGAAALDALADLGVSIDLLITDLVMPGPNGIEVARQIRRDRPGLPVLLMSGYASDALLAERTSDPSLELLEKPFSAAELLDRVAAVLASATHATD
jgi:CheY-like chemotaxis protein